MTGDSAQARLRRLVDGDRHALRHRLWAHKLGRELLTHIVEEPLPRSQDERMDREHVTVNEIVLLCSPMLPLLLLGKELGQDGSEHFQVHVMGLALQRALLRPRDGSRERGGGVAHERDNRAVQH